ncbi:MAG: VIT domain-containing protein [Rubrivivax sp.]
MFEEPSAGFVLQARDGDAEPPVLDEVRAEGRLEGLLYTLTLRQRYTNTSSGPLEVVYTFPLPEGAVLLGLAATLGASRLEARVLPRAEAEQEYEEALEAGDAPVLLEVSAGGLHTANIGNLKPQESIELEIRFAQLATPEQGRLRIALPTTVAPRYGNPLAGSLQPHQVPQASLQAEYPLHLAVTACGPLARATVDCPTHPVRVASVEAGLRVELAEGARLDRDVVLLFNLPQAEPESPAALLCMGPDRFLDTEALDPQLQLDVDTGATPKPAPVVAVAAFCLPPLAAADERAVRLKLLVDCSGSMSGDSIASARRALTGVADGLRPGDEVSLTRFGSSAELALPPSSCSLPRTLAALREAILGTEANLGGTEMQRALEAVFKLGSPASGEGRSDVLLLTDGEVWAVEALIKAARRSGHRVFVIGVGASPAEHALRALADATGGACEFATPGEGLEAAARRMLTRMRAPGGQVLDVRWGLPGAQPPLWCLAPPAHVFPGDTAVAMAGFAPGCAPTQASLHALDGASPQQVMLARAGGAEPDHAGDDLARLAAWHRIRRGAAGPTASIAPVAPVALAYQLLTPDTRCVLVHRRADADKPEEEAALHRVRSMLAAGWGGTGSVAGHTRDAALMASHMASHMSAPTVWRSARAAPVASLDLVMREYESVRFSLRQGASAPEAPPPGSGMRFGKAAGGVPVGLEELCNRVLPALREGFPLARIDQALRGASLEDDLRQALQELERELVAAGVDPAVAWLLLIEWELSQPHTAAPSADRRAVDTALMRAGVPSALHADAHRLLDRLLGDPAASGGLGARIARLARAMARP